MSENQPTKLAALEGLERTQAGAPFTVGGFYENGEVKFGLEIPRLLSLLAEHDPNAVIEGLDAVPPEVRPPVGVVRTAFQTMVSIGTALALLGVGYFVYWLRRRRLPSSPWFYRAVVAAGPLALVALIAGWITTEVGRQPWVVYQVMFTSQAVTGAEGIPIAYGFLIGVYLGLLAVVIWLLRRLAGRSPDVEVGAPVEGP